MISNFKFSHFQNGIPILNVSNNQNELNFTFHDTLNLSQKPKVQKDKLEELQEELEKAKQEKLRKEKEKQEQEVKRKQKEFEDFLQGEVEKVREQQRKHREENPIETFIDDEFDQGKQFLEKYSPETEKQIEEVVEEIDNDTPDFQQSWRQSTDVFSFWKGFKWVLNLIFVATPWLLAVLILDVTNIYLNVSYNTFWAGGNIFLLFNTHYLIVQSFISLPLVAEIPIWLRRFKPVRFISLIWAVLYNTIYILALIDFIYLLYVFDKKKTDVFQLFESMFFGYNLILHATIFPINLAIMTKELFLEFFQLNQKRKGAQENLNLGFSDIIDALASFAKLLQGGIVRQK